MVMFLILKKQHILAALACTALFIGLPILCLGGKGKDVPTTAANTNWGLSFPEKGKNILWHREKKQPLPRMPWIIRAESFNTLTLSICPGSIGDFGM